MRNTEPILTAYENLGESVLNRIGGTLKRGADDMADIVNGDKTASDIYRNGKGYNWGSIAATAGATYVGGSSAYRLASGGGIYKDADGNTDLIGIPFI